VVFVSLVQEIIPLSYKLQFETTNNVAEYEALILGLRDANDPDLCRNTMKYRNTHKRRDAVEIRLHFINNK
jgi:ribonuclease HI